MSRLYYQVRRYFEKVLALGLALALFGLLLLALYVGVQWSVANGYLGVIVP